MGLTKRITMSPKTPPAATFELVLTSSSAAAATTDRPTTSTRRDDKLRSSDLALPDIIVDDDDADDEEEQCLIRNHRQVGADQTPAVVAAAGAVAPPPAVRIVGGQRQQHSPVSAISYYLFLGSVILLWFIANGMNGIAMRSLATDIRQQTYSKNEHLLCILSISMAVTATQLLLAFVLGCFLTLLYEYVYLLEDRSRVSLRQVWQRLHQYDDPTTSVLLALLHGTAMYSTNLGFMYGSASLVQVIKLLEPFETVLLQNYLTRAQQVLSVGVVSSVVLTVGAAYTLVHADQTRVHYTALAFAVISTLSMSSRNVLQKQLQQRKQQQQQQASSTVAVSVNGKSDAVLNGSPEPTRLEQALGQFTKLSLYAGLVMAAIAFIFHMWLIRTAAEYQIAVDTIARDRELNWRRIFVWHLLFNSSSMISIAFVSALTHSLFNAGQRVCSVSMGILWFDDEQLTTGKIISMGVVSMGCCWYIVESQRAAKQAAAAAASGSSSSSSSNNNRDATTNWELLKPMVSLGLLQMILVFGYYENEDAMRQR